MKVKLQLVFRIILIATPSAYTINDIPWPKSIRSSQAKEN
jgi:hypothetical protein